MNSPVSRVDLMSIGRVFQAFGATTAEDTSLVCGTSSSCLPAERSEARPGMSATGVTSSEIYKLLYIPISKNLAKFTD